LMTVPRLLSCLLVRLEHAPIRGRLGTTSFRR
jgi:hypothetical protein